MQVLCRDLCKLYRLHNWDDLQLCGVHVSCPQAGHLNSSCLNTTHVVGVTNPVAACSLFLSRTLCPSISPFLSLTCFYPFATATVIKTHRFQPALTLNHIKDVRWHRYAWPNPNLSCWISTELDIIQSLKRLISLYICLVIHGHIPVNFPVFLFVAYFSTECWILASICNIWHQHGPKRFSTNQPLEIWPC